MENLSFKMPTFKNLAPLRVKLVEKFILNKDDSSLGFNECEDLFLVKNGLDATTIGGQVLFSINEIIQMIENGKPNHSDEFFYTDLKDSSLKMKLDSFEKVRWHISRIEHYMVHFGDFKKTIQSLRIIVSHIEKNDLDCIKPFENFYIDFLKKHFMCWILIDDSCIETNIRGFSKFTLKN